MKNAFSNVDKNKAAIKSQQKTPTGVGLKKRGRPKRPNMVRKLIKVDEVLYAQVAELAATEHTTIASIISRALKKELSEKDNI